MLAMTRTISDEIKQTRPFRTKSAEATVALLRTAHLLRRRVEEIVASAGITSQQYNVLRILRGARAPLPTMEISERMIEPACGITRLIGALEEKGLVKREQWPGDRRQVLCQITPAGLRLLERLEPAMNEFDDATAAALSGVQVDALIEALAVIRERLEP